MHLQDGVRGGRPRRPTAQKQEEAEAVITFQRKACNMQDLGVVSWQVFSGQVRADNSFLMGGGIFVLICLPLVETVMVTQEVVIFLGCSADNIRVHYK